MAAVTIPATERTGWRDQDLSARHRRWGVNCPAVDLDFLLVEYCLGEPAALVEYKHHRARPFDLGHPTYRAVRLLADREPAVPFLIARYWPGRWAFHVTAVNTAALEALGPELWLSEIEFVRELHRLRNRTVQQRVLQHLNNERPPAQPSHNEQRRLL